MLLGGKRTNPLTWLDDDFTTASSSVYTYGPGEHAVERPAEDKPAASTLQTICASNLTNAQAMAVFSPCDPAAAGGHAAVLGRIQRC